MHPSNATNDSERHETPTSPSEPIIQSEGRFAYDGLQRVFHEKARLGIMTSLLSYAQGLSFAELKQLCSLSDGNLSRHIDVLRENGYLQIEKSGAGRSAKTICHATAAGKASFYEYLEELQRVIADTASLASPRYTPHSSKQHSPTQQRSPQLRAT